MSAATKEKEEQDRWKTREEETPGTGEGEGAFHPFSLGRSVAEIPDFFREKNSRL
jgi:hypothetical protein